MQFSSSPKNILLKNVTHVAIGLLVFSMISVLGIVFYINGKTLMQTELQSQLRTLADSASLMFDSKDLDELHTLDDSDKPVYAKIIFQLNNLRTRNPDIQYAYILRPTKKAGMFEFVADADSLHPREVIDQNNDGIIDEADELAPPGTPYDISGAPAISAALEGPTTTDAPYSDQWGTYMSGFAPIFDSQGTVIAVIGFDMDLKDFEKLSTRIFTPFALLLMISAALALSGYVMLEVYKNRMEAKQKMDEERSLLLQVSSHQLGSPLTLLQWALEELKSAHAKEGSAINLDRFILDADDAVERLGGVLKQFQQAERVLAGMVKAKQTVLTPSRLIKDVEAELTPHLERKKQHLELVNDKEHAIEIDEALIAAVIRETIINASDFSPIGSTITIRLSMHGSMQQIDISDQGCGIPEKDLTSLFKPFMRASNARIMKPEGSGLGLYISRGIIQKLGGTMSIASVGGKGTTVTIRLPIPKA